MQEIKKPNFVKNRKLAKTTMFATTLLVAIALLVSSGASMTIVNEKNISVYSYGNNQERSASSNSGVTFQEAPSILEQTNKPMMGGYNPDRAEATLYYHLGQSSGVGLTGPGTFEGAMRLTPTELGLYDGWWMKKVNFWHYASYSATHDGTVKIYGNGTATSPGSLLS
jgi:hypothetical protein